MEPASSLPFKSGKEKGTPSRHSNVRADLVKWLVVALIATAALSMQLSVYPNHDVAWVLWGAREMFHGAIWGRDIIEPNPPLAWYISMPAAWLARLLGTPIAATFEAMVAGAALCSVAAFDRFARSDLMASKGASHLPTLVVALFLLLFPYRDFGQREHLMLIGALPYVALTAHRRSSEVPVSIPIAILIGASAGLGFALKPYFLAVPLFVEATNLIILRRWKSVLRPEVITIAVVVGFYGLYVLIFVPEYMETVVPLARSIYWSFDVPIDRQILTLIMPIVALVVTGVMLGKSTRPLPLALCAATAGFLLSCVLQHKAYSYHLLPVTAGAAIALAAAVSDIGLSRLRLAGSVLLVVLLFQPALQTGNWWRLHRPGGPAAIAQTQLIDEIDRFAADGSFLVVAVHPFPAFPTALYTTATQVSRTNSQWFLPAVVQLRDGAKPPFSGALDVAERNAREFMLHDLSHTPNVVIIDTNSARHTVSRSDFDFLSFYREDARFRKAWLPYREVGRLDGFRLFVREGGQNR